MVSCTPLTSWPPLEWPSHETLATWCDRTVGTLIGEIINREMVKWCSVFLDEGEASWSMPHRDQTFYRAWKSLAQHDMTLGLIGIREAAKKIRTLPDHPEDAVLDSLTKLRIPKQAWEEYLSLHLAAIPGWTGYIKWRAHQSGYPWQQQFPIDLVKYLAVRLFYERELAARTCRDRLGIDGNYEEIRAYMEGHPHAYWVRRQWVAERLPKPAAKQTWRLSRSNRGQDPSAWEELGRQQYSVRLDQDVGDWTKSAAHYLLRLARALSIDPAAIESTSPSDVRTLLNWLAGFPVSQHGARWLEAFEARHRRQALTDLAAGARAVSTRTPPIDKETQSRPLAQIVFCIDVRSEVFRRHLEHRGGYETLGLAGFFGVPLDYQPFSAHHAVAHCPVLLKPKNRVREVPRSYHGALAERHKAATRLSEAAHTLLHDLKENVITPYVMVEALGWFFGVPLLGKTLLPRWYHRAGRWLKQLLTPSVATTLTVDKIRREEAEEMIAAEQHALIRELVRERFGLAGAALSPALLEQIRKKAIGQDGINGQANALDCTPEAEESFYQE
ncbi:MAG: putative inorganic carbon transporter subunit DabA, partial [Nitrospiraceae bacterium]